MAEEQHPFQQAAAPAEPPPKQQSTANPFASGIKKSRTRLIVLCIGGGVVALGLIVFIVSLTNKGGILIENTDINQVTVTLNGRSVKEKQQGDAVFVSAYPGQYRLQVSKADYQPFIQDVLLGKKQTVHIRPAYALLPKQTQADHGTATIDFVRPSLDQNYLYYAGSNKQTLYRMGVASRVPMAITQDAFSNLTDVEWSVKSDVALIQQGTSTYLQEIPSFDFVHQATVKIGGSEIVSAVWDPTDSNRIAAVYAPSTGEHSLVFADKNFTDVSRKADISALTNPKLVWSPDASTLLLINRSSDQSQNNIYSYTTATGAYKQLTQAGSITDASFSPNSDMVLYESKGTTLNLIKSDGSDVSPIDVSGKVSQAAWKDNGSFFLPDASRSALYLYTIDGKHQDLSFTFTDSKSVQGMYYFSTTKSLIFYTSNAIYSVNVGI